MKLNFHDDIHCITAANLHMPTYFIIKQCLCVLVIHKGKVDANAF